MRTEDHFGAGLTRQTENFIAPRAGRGKEGGRKEGKEGGPTYHEPSVAELGGRMDVDGSQVPHDAHGEAGEEAREEGQAALPQGVREAIGPESP